MIIVFAYVSQHCASFGTKKLATLERFIISFFRTGPCACMQSYTLSLIQSQNCIWEFASNLIQSELQTTLKDVEYLLHIYLLLFTLLCYVLSWQMSNGVMSNGDVRAHQNGAASEAVACKEMCFYCFDVIVGLLKSQELHFKPKFSNEP